MAPDITIVVPVYNVKEYLTECLASLPDEAGKVLVTDGSNDGSEDICRQYANNRPNVVLVNKENGGLSDARNAGMEHVATPYIFFLDSDDRIDGEKLLKALAYAEDNNLDWLQCGYGYDYGDRLLIYKGENKPSIMTREKVMSEIVRDGLIKNFAWGKIYRTSIVKRFEFPKGKYFEDSYWQYKIIHSSKKMGIFPELVTFYRSRTDSISGKFSSRNLDLLEGLCNRLEFLIVNYPPIAPCAAVELWSIAKSFDKMAEASDSETHDAYSSALNEIVTTYSPLIEKGFSEQPITLRTANLLRYRTNKLLDTIGELTLRIYGRLQPSQLYVLPLNK